jgi:hypothetical protein
MKLGWLIWRTRKRKRKEKVALLALPRGFVDDLPDEDQRALLEQVGKPVVLNGYDEDGRAELEFADRAGTFHTIWVEPKFIESKAK